MMIMIMKTPGSQVGSPVAEGKTRKGRKGKRDERPTQRLKVIGDVS